MVHRMGARCSEGDIARTSLLEQQENGAERITQETSSLGRSSDKGYFGSSSSIMTSSHRTDNGSVSEETQKMLDISNSGASNGEAAPTEIQRFVPPDGGMQAWLVMISSFLCNGILFGIINSFGVVFVYLRDSFKDDPNAAFKSSLVASIGVGMTFLLSPVSGMVADKYGLRRTALFGGFVACLGMTLSSFFVHKIEVLCFTYGVLFGSGASLLYTPSLVILGHYWHRHMGIVNGVVTAGSSVFTMILPHVLDYVLKNLGLQNCFRIFAAVTALLMVCALSFKPLMPLVAHERGEERLTPCSRFWSQIINVHNWRNKKYVIWALAIPSALFGYFVPYVHIVAYVNDILPDSNGETLITCIGITSGIGRLIFGKVADMPGVNRIALQQISFVSIGICTMLLTAAPHFGASAFYAMIGFSLVMGLFDGCFISLLGPIAFDICGPAGASQAIGFLLGMCSVPLTLGPPIAGYLRDHIGDYTAAFIAAGFPPIIGASLMCFIYRVAVSPPEPVECNGGLQESKTTTTIVPQQDEQEEEEEEMVGADSNGSAHEAARFTV